jgi:hypothetical protein
MKSSVFLPPFRQGQLDGLCGIYAVINAVRLVLGEAATKLSNDDWQSFFATLLYSADDTIGAANAAAGGIETKPLRKVLKSAVRHLRDEHGVSLVARSLLPRHHRPAFPEFLNILRGTVEVPNQTVIVTIEGFLSHWTVLRAVSESSFQLFDSSGYDRITIANCRMTYEPKRVSRREYLFPAKAAFVVGLR